MSFSIDDHEFKLYYFDISGKGEALRLALTYLDIPFEDYRFKDRNEFMAMKTDGTLHFGQVPALQVKNKASGDTMMFTQSAAILRLIAKMGECRGKALYPLCPSVAAQADAIIDQEADTFAGFRVARYKERFGFAFLNDEANAGLVKQVDTACQSEIIPGHLKRLEKIIARGGTKWMAGTELPSIADFHWVPILNMINQGGWAFEKGYMNAFPTLKKLMDDFNDIPQIKKYYEGKELS